MRVHIRSAERKCTILLPTRMLFNKSILNFGLRVGRRYSDAVPDISPAVVDALCDAIRHIKKTNGTWELVHIQSADGEEIRIIL